MANFTEKQKQLAIQSIKKFFRDRGDERIHPIVLDDDGNEIRGAELRARTEYDLCRCVINEFIHERSPFLS